MKGARRSKGISSLQIPASWSVTEDGFLSETVENPKTCTSWKTVETPAEIEFFIQMRNRQHFGQAQGTPFTTTPLSQRFDWAANSVESELTILMSFKHCSCLTANENTAPFLGIKLRRVHFGKGY
jgi:hypothetical protein